MENTKNEALKNHLEELIQKAKAEQKTEIKVPNDYARRLLEKFKAAREKRLQEAAKNETPVD